MIEQKIEEYKRELQASQQLEQRLIGAIAALEDLLKQQQTEEQPSDVEEIES